MSHVLVHQVNVPYRYLPRLIIAFFLGGDNIFGDSFLFWEQQTTKAIQRDNFPSPRPLKSRRTGSRVT